eukprot:9463280-Pyramimonas_sp.AAC.1
MCIRDRTRAFRHPGLAMPPPSNSPKSNFFRLTDRTLTRAFRYLKRHRNGKSAAATETEMTHTT